MKESQTIANKATIKWAKDERPFHAGKACFLGSWRVGNVEWVSGSRDDKDPHNYGSYSDLPGLKKLLDKYRTEKEAMNKVESATRYWLKKALGAEDGE